MEKNMQQKEKNLYTKSIQNRNNFRFWRIWDYLSCGRYRILSESSIKKYCPLEDRKISYEKGKKDFLREARTLSALSDITAIVRVLDYFEERGDAYIVMEYVKGHSLRKYIENRIESMNFSQAWDFSSNN